MISEAAISTTQTVSASKQHVWPTFAARIQLFLSHRPTFPDQLAFNVYNFRIMAAPSVMYASDLLVDALESISSGPSRSQITIHRNFVCGKEANVEFFLFGRNFLEFLQPERAHPSSNPLICVALGLFSSLLVLRDILCRISSIPMH